MKRVIQLAAALVLFAAGLASAWSPVAWWETGLLQASDWTARWIGPAPGPDDTLPSPSPLLRRAIVLGSVLASFTVEQFSLDRLRTLTPEEIRARYAEARTLAHFDELEADLFNGASPTR